MIEPSLPRDATAAVAPRPSLLRSATSTFGTNIAVAILSFVNVLITARMLGVSGRGSVAFLTTIGFLSAQLATLGIFQAVANFGAREPQLARALAGASLALSLLSGTVAASVVAVIVVLFPAVGGGSETGELAIVLVAIPMLVLQPSLAQLLRAHYVFTLANAAWVLTVVTNLILVALLGILGALTVATAVASWIAGQMLCTALLGWGVLRRLDGFGRFDAALTRRMLGFGLKAYFGRVMLLGNYRLDQWLLGGMAGPRELGLYSVAVAWVEALFFLPTALTMAQRPDLVRASREEAERQASVVFRATLLITFVLAVAMFALAPFLCETLFGEAFRESVGMLRILIVGAFGIVALKLLGNAITAQRKPMLETAAISTAFVAIVALDLILIPTHGGLGASLASSVAYSVGGIAMALIFIRALGGRLRDLLPRGNEIMWLWRRLRSRVGGSSAGAPQ